LFSKKTVLLELVGSGERGWVSKRRQQLVIGRATTTTRRATTTTRQAVATTRRATATTRLLVINQ